MRRYLSAILALCLLCSGAAAAASVPTAAASDWWCWDDPVLVIENQVLLIRAGVPETLRTRVVLAEIVVTVPENVEAKITASTQPRFPATSRLERAGSVAPGQPVTVQATLTVRATTSMPIALLIRQPNGEEKISPGSSESSAAASFTLAGTRATANRAR